MKKISPNIYAKAFLETAEKDARNPPRFIENLFAVIKRNGDWPRREAIAGAIEKLWRTKHNRHLVIIESARHLTPSQREMITKSFPASYDFKDTQNSELLAGVRLTVNDELERDESLLHLMNQLFK